ncbi:HalOD1 output domain-containing protein [Halopiger thermotolerans]
MPETTLDAAHDSPSLRLIDALADATDTDPLELDPLYDAVDPEALDRFLEGDSTGAATVQFSYDGHCVEVRSDGVIAVDSTIYDECA